MCNNDNNLDKTEGESRYVKDGDDFAGDGEDIFAWATTDDDHKTDMISFVYLVIVLSNMYIQSWFRLGGRLNELNRTKENIHLHTFLDYLKKTKQKKQKEENQINVKVCFVFALCTDHISLFISLVLSGQLPF